MDAEHHDDRGAGHPPPLPPNPYPYDDHGAGGVGSKRGRSPSRYPPGDPGYDDDRRRSPQRSPQRRRFDGPPPGGHRGRRGPGGPRGRRYNDDGAVLSFREFCLRRMSDHATPSECERAYEQYKANNAESFRRRDFDAVRDDEKTREAHDPRRILSRVLARDAAAVEAAAAFTAEVAAGTLAPLPPAAPNPAPDVDVPDAGEGEGAGAEGAGEGAGEGAAEGAAEGTPAPASASADFRDARGRWPVPVRAWNPTRVARDLRQCAKLVEVVDAERSVAPAEDRFGDAALIAATMDAPDPIPEVRLRDLPSNDGRSDGGDRADPDAMDADEDAANAAGDADAAVSGDGTGGVAADVIAAALDRRVLYLWRAHGLDYYASLELTHDEYLAAPPASRVGAERCLARPPAPSAEELEAAEAEAGAGSEASAPASSDRFATNSTYQKFANRVDRWVKQRCARGDPTEKLLRRERVESELEAWKESCVVRHDENRYGCTLSSKLFIGAEYVMKHINSKQAAAVDARREKILDAVYLDNYLAAARHADKSAKKEKAKEKTQRGADRRAKNKGRAGKDIRAIAEAIVQAKEGGGAAPETVPPHLARARGTRDLDAPKTDRVVLDYGDI